DRFTCENDSIGGYQIGMKIATGDDLRAASSPLLTNIRIRNSGSASRNDNIGILLEDNVRGHLKDSIIEAAGTGVKATALNRTVLERLQIFNCHTGMKIAGNNQQRKLKGHLIALESAYTLAHPSPDYRALALQGTANWQIQQNTISGYGKILTANNTGAQAIDFNSNIAWSHQMQTAPFSLENASISTNYNNLHTDQLAGEGNIYIEPLFMDAAARDYSLHYDCVCIDSGSPHLPQELDGTRADMGAFTYLHRAAVEPDMRYIVAGTTVHFSNASWGHDHPASACEWDLNNDGQIESTARDWQYHFDTPGVYTLRLTMNTGTLQDTQVYEAFIVVQAPQLNAPEALNLGVQDNSIHLNWEPVTLNIGGIPQVVEYYIVYAADTPDAFFQYVGHTTGADTQFTHVGGADAPCRFYYVIGFNGSELELREYISRNQNVLREKKTDIELKKK
ncbi:MAG: PKD domain-containing protein, partial [Candidatus Cloacimonadaceae bacterium]